MAVASGPVAAAASGCSASLEPKAGGRLRSCWRSKTKQKLRDQNMTSLADTIDADQTLLRILHYPSYDDAAVEPGSVRAAAHEDINHIPLLPVGRPGRAAANCVWELGFF